MNNSPASSSKSENKDSSEITQWEPQSLALPEDPVADAIEARLVQCLNSATKPEEIE
ncbi:MAG: hypothetical protein F6K30_14495 [Cyanothece sp. SIO2G6]|nr:hypothetical protein [Cyanothece sp. SIO2G6]